MTIHRGTVARNIDPEGRGRVQVKVPDVLQQVDLMWAMPCSPYAGNGVGLFTVPPVGANVWVDFENDDPALPIVLGGYWGPQDEVPAPLAIAQHKAFATETLSLLVSDIPGRGGLTLTIKPPSVITTTTIAITASGVEISIGASKIKLDGVRVSINDGALEVI